MKIGSNDTNDTKDTQSTDEAPRRKLPRWVIYTGVGAVIVFIAVGSSIGKPTNKTKTATEQSSTATVDKSSSSNGQTATGSGSIGKLGKVKNKYDDGINKAKVIPKADNTVDMKPVISKAMKILYNYASSSTSNSSRADKLSKYMTESAIDTVIPADQRTAKAQDTQSLKVTYKTTAEPYITVHKGGVYEVLVAYSATAFGQSQDRQDSYKLYTNHNKITKIESEGTVD